MKKLASILVLLMVLAMALAALDFKAVDDLYDQGTDNRMVYDSLQSMLKNAGSDTEKAEVLWRLWARVCLLPQELPSTRSSRVRAAHRLPHPQHRTQKTFRPFL